MRYLCVFKDGFNAVTCATVTVDTTSTAATLAALGDSGFRAERRAAEGLRAAVAARCGDLRAATFRLVLVLALAGRFFFTEFLFMELTIASNLLTEQKI